MLEVNIEKILPVTEARDKFNQIIDGVENSDDLYVLTKNGKPAAVIVGVHHLEKLTGTSHKELMGEVEVKQAEEIEEKTPEETTPAVVEEAAPNPTEAPSPDAVLQDNTQTPPVKDLSGQSSNVSSQFNYDSVTNNMINDQKNSAADQTGVASPTSPADSDQDAASKSGDNFTFPDLDTPSSSDPNNTAVPPAEPTNTSASAPAVSPEVPPVSSTPPANDNNNLSSAPDPSQSTSAPAPMEDVNPTPLAKDPMQAGNNTNTGDTNQSVSE